MQRNGSSSYQAPKKVSKRELTPEEIKIYQEGIVDSTFMKLFRVPLADKIEEKNGLSYLSWADAWCEVKKRFPKASYKVYEDPNTGCIYFTDGRSCWVKVSVTIEDAEYIEYLPIMDYKNQAILLENLLSTDVNKSIQRALTKACARHGLGLSLYGAEDLGISDKGQTKQSTKQTAQPQPVNTAPQAVPTMAGPAVTQPVAQNQAAPQLQVIAAPARKVTASGYQRASSLKFTFGNHDGETLGSVLATDRQYIEYIADVSKFEPKTDEAKRTQQACIYMLNYLQQSVS